MTTMMTRGLSLVLLILSASVFPQEVSGDAHAETLLGKAEASTDHTILVEAVKAAGLADALKGEGPLTIMAPTDAAFEAAFSALSLTKDQVLEGAKGGDETLKTILLYHAVGSKVMAADVTDGMEVETLQGEKFTVNAGGDGTTTITGGGILPAATVTSADIMASNGVVHVIDQVLIPPAIAKAWAAADTSNVNLYQAAQGAGFTTLLAAVDKAGLADALKGDGPLTIMAPTNAAFEKAFKALDITPQQALELPDLKAILMYHAVGKKVMSSDISDGMEVETLQGEKFTVNMKDGKATITGGDILPAATVETGDIAVSNGVAHVIDQVLIPPTISKALKGGAAEKKPADDKKAGAAPAPATAPAPAPAAADDKSVDHASRSLKAATGLLLGIFGLSSLLLA